MAGATETVRETETSQELPGVSGTTYLSIDGMTCGNCARHVTQALQGVSGVRSASVDLDSHQAVVSWQPNIAPDEGAVIQAVEKEGFGAQLMERDAGRPERALAGWGLNLALGVPITALLMLAE